MIIIDNDSFGSKKIILPNFSLEELMCKCGDCKITFLHESLLLSLVRLRTEWNNKIQITSAFRCQTHNKKVGGHPHSFHCKGGAVDIVLPVEEEKQKMFKKLCEKYFDFVLLYLDKGFVHCDNNEKIKKESNFLIS